MNKYPSFYLLLICFWSSITLANNQNDDNTETLELLSINKYVNKCTICTKEPTIEILPFSYGTKTKCFTIIPKEKSCLLDCKTHNKKIPKDATQVYRYVIHLHYKHSDIGMPKTANENQEINQLSKILSGKKITSLEWKMHNTKTVDEYMEQGDEKEVEYKNDEQFKVTLSIYDLDYTTLHSKRERKHPHTPPTDIVVNTKKQNHSDDEDNVVNSQQLKKEITNYWVDLFLISLVCFSIYLMLTTSNEEADFYLKEEYSDQF